MATSNTARSCLRCLRTSQSLSHRTASPIIPRRCLHASAPLYLDFLAPSWQSPTKIATPRPPRIRNSNQLRTPHRRPIFTSPRHSANAITNPRKDPSTGAETTITITPRAATRLQTIAATDSNPNLALRVSVESGGCHGFQYLMSLTSTKDMDPEEDTLFENEEVVGGKGEYRAKVVMDEPSLELLGGSSVDYTMELIGSQFKVTGIPGAKSSCGCGTSFDIAA